MRRRSKNLIDRWHNENYIRVAVIDGKVIKISVSQKSEDKLLVTLESKGKITLQVEEKTKLLLKKVLGLDVDLVGFYKICSKDEVLKPLVLKFKGMRPPRFPTVFEGLLNAICCQQVSLDVGILVLNRLSEKYGEKIKSGGVPFFAFPEPEDLAEIPEEDIKKVGLSLQKARYIKNLSMSLVKKETDLAKLEKMTNSEAIKYLTSLHGVGRWSAEYALLRSLGRLDTFPGDDVGAQNNLQKLLFLSQKPNYDKIKELSHAWHPYEGLIYFHLLLQKLKAKGAI